MLEDHKLPKLKQQVEQTFQEMNMMQTKKDTLQATIGSIEARKRLMLKNRRNKEQMDKNIEKIIKCEPDALHAVNLSKLLKKNWTEYPRAYRI